MSLGPPPAFGRFADNKGRVLLTALRSAVAPILANNLLPHFTDHSVDHSDNLVSLVDQLQEGIKIPLTDPELVILYGACYLHDIGMQYERADKTATIQNLNLLPPWGEQGESQRRELLRRFHHKISAEMVLSSIHAAEPPIGFQLTHEYFGAYVANLCHAHCIPGDGSEYQSLVCDGPNIRMGLLSAFLRIADILDESRRRASRAKERTLMLDVLAQSHWWRHYYTEDITLDFQQRAITVWFDFPTQFAKEYFAIIPELQVPWIQAELFYHNATLLANGCQWYVKTECREKAYSDAPAMPENVLTEMLKQLAARRRVADESQRIDTLTKFKEAQPSIQRRIQKLNDAKSAIKPSEYLIELSNIATDLFELGGQRGARSMLFHPFCKDFKNLPADDRLNIGLRLLQWVVSDGDDFSSRALVTELVPEFSSVPIQDARKWEFEKLRIVVLNLCCDYENALVAINDAISWAAPAEQTWLQAEKLQMELLQGDFQPEER